MDSALKGANTVNQDDDIVVFHNRYTKEKLESLVTEKLYPPAIHYAVIYNSPPDFEKAISSVLEVRITGTDKPQISFPIKVYETRASPPSPTPGPVQAEATPQACISLGAVAAVLPSPTLDPAQTEAASQPASMSLWDAAIPQTSASTTQSLHTGNAADISECPPTSASASLAQCTPTGTPSHLSECSPLARVTSSPFDPLHQTPMLRDLNNKVVVRVAGRWETVGLELNIEDFVLQAIKTPNGSNEEHCRDMFRRWLRRAVGLSPGPGLACCLQWRAAAAVK